jgi:hypothetical protein
MAFSFSLRRFGIGAMAVAALACAAVPAQAQVRQQIADKAAVQAGNGFVTKINGQSCSDFATTLKSMKSGGSGGSSSSMSSKLKSNTEARTQFVNIVAAPLLNKMITCDLLPGM